MDDRIMEKCWKCRGFKIIPTMGGMTIKCTECQGVGYIDKTPESKVEVKTLELRKDKAFKDLKKKTKLYQQSPIRPMEEGESEEEVSLNEGRE